MKTKTTKTKAEAIEAVLDNYVTHLEGFRALPVDDWPGGYVITPEAECHCFLCGSKVRGFRAAFLITRQPGRWTPPKRLCKRCALSL